MKRREQQRQIDRAHRVQRADRQPPGLDAGERLQLGLPGVDLGERAPRAGDEHVARLRHRDLARRALDERHPDLRLEAADLLRQRRLGDVLAGGRASEVTLVGERDEVAQLSQIHALSLSLTAILGLGLLSPHAGACSVLPPARPRPTGYLLPSGGAARQP